ncbi:MAG: hypothetical protein KAT66_03540, partial [Candidatus Lokiarchaeota archaeon]|nr:hypothetical protein [Candidatus Lokiarchaeota archaeon]
MTDEFKEEEKESKSEKDNDKVDKEFLSKAKDSRDIIDKKLRTFENSIEDISETISNGETEVEKELDKKALEEINEEIKESLMKLDSISKKID